MIQSQVKGSFKQPGLVEDFMKTDLSITPPGNFKT